jgi:hypothetical protein
LNRLGAPDIAESELKEIIDVVKDPSIQALSRGALSKVYAQMGRNPEALEQARSALEFLDMAGGTERGALQEAHSAYARALEANGMSAEAAQFRAENPLTSMEPLPGGVSDLGKGGVPDLGKGGVPDLGKGGVPDLGKGGVSDPVPGLGKAAAAPKGAAIPAMPAGGVPTSVPQAGRGAAPTTDGAKSGLDSLMGKLDDAKKTADGSPPKPKP